jgi:hypothetical protein
MPKYLYAFLESSSLMSFSNVFPICVLLWTLFLNIFLHIFLNQNYYYYYYYYYHHHYHHHRHHHVSQNTFIRDVFWGILNVMWSPGLTSFVSNEWWVQAFRRYTVPPTITFRRWRQFVRNVSLYLPNYTASFPGGSDYEPSLLWKPPSLNDIAFVVVVTCQ